MPERSPGLSAYREGADVKAAGGIVCRRGPFGLAEIVLVHRPGAGYDDWTLPKGKLTPGETPEDAAIREVFEETGLRCRLLEPFGCTNYVDRKGRDKTVCYWIMEVEEAELFAPTFEVDQVRWVTVDEALDLLTYDRDRQLLSSMPREYAA